MTTTQVPRVELRAEPKPDAPLTKLWKLALEAGSTVVTLGLVGLFIAYLIPSFLPGKAFRDCEVMIVAQELETVEAPAGGRCEPVRPFQHGERVRKGQPLVRFHSPELEAQYSARRRRLEKLLERKLLLDESPLEYELTSSTYDSQREFRQLVLDIADTRSDLERLEEILSNRVICSPADGCIHFGLANSQAVKAHDPVAYIFPEGGILLLEVKGPLDLLKELIDRHRVEAVIQTAEGKVHVAARPNPATLRTSVQPEKNGSASRLHGIVQCSLDPTHWASLTPGLHGLLDN